MAKRKMTIEDLALLVKKGFDHTASKEEIFSFKKETGTRFAEVDTRFAEVDKRFAEMTEAITKLAKVVEENFRHVFARLDKIRGDISDLPAMREELHDLRQRVDRLERKVGAAR